jgi:hypothetical protein
MSLWPWWLWSGQNREVRRGQGTVDGEVDRGPSPAVDWEDGSGPQPCCWREVSSDIAGEQCHALFMVILVLWHAMREGAEMVKVAEEGMPESRSVWIGLGHICGTRLLVAWLCSLSLYSVTRWAPMGKVADPLLTCFISDSRPAIPIGGILHPDSQPLSTKLELTHTHIQLSIYDIWSSLNLTYSGPCCVLMWDCGGLVPPWLLKVSNPYHIPGLTLLCEARMKP